MVPDIVDRLRAMAGPIKPNVCTEAADEIERLRAGGCARDQKTTQYCAEAVRLQAEIDRLREERNEAQREICRRDCKLDTDWINSPFPMRRSTPEMFADLYGWDCFEETSK